ncbi:hypothetical protein PG985_013228 [Apiospora marii]
MQSTETVSYGLDRSLVYHPTTGNLSRRDQQSKLPGQPWVSLSPNDALLAYIQRNDGASSLEWLQRKVGSLLNRKIVPLHAIGRIHLTEHPDLHLARWFRDNSIYLKPIPVYMFSTAFWAWLAAADTQTHAAALGFMRTYSHLICYEADFRLATELCLIPRIPPATKATKTTNDDNWTTYWDGDGSSSGSGCRMTYEDFVEFIIQFSPAHVPNSLVAPRYWYGELGLYHIYSDYPRRMFSEPREQEGEGQLISSSNSSSSSSSNETDKGLQELRRNLFLIPLWTAIGLVLRLIVEGAWDGAPWVVQWIILWPMGVMEVSTFVMALHRFFEWVFEEATPRRKVLDAKKVRIRPMAKSDVAFLLATALVAGFVTVWTWDGAYESITRNPLVPMAVYAVVALLVVAVQISQWIFGEWVPISEVSKTEETEKEVETKTKEKAMLIEGLDMV